MSTPTNSLKAIAEDKGNEAVTKSTSFLVDPDAIILEDGFNLREEGPETDAHIERLYLSYKAGAFIPPVDVSVVDGKITAREGHCRTRAARRMKLEFPDFKIQCRQLKGNESEFVYHMVGTGTGGKPLNPLETGRGYKRLIAYGQTPQQIATRLGLSVVTIHNGLALADAPVAIQEAIKRGDVAASTARDAMRNGSEGVKALENAIEGLQQPNAEETAGEPATDTPKKKKKITGKTLQGTPAGKPLPPALAASAEGKILVMLERKAAINTAAFLRQMCGDDEELKGVAATLEVALM